MESYKAIIRTVQREDVKIVNSATSENGYIGEEICTVELIDWLIVDLRETTSTEANTNNKRMKCDMCEYKEKFDVHL